MRVYHHCVNISRIVVSAELTCDDGLWRKVAGWEKEARLKRPISQISRACKLSCRSEALLEPHLLGLGSSEHELYLIIQTASQRELDITLLLERITAKE